MQYLTLPKSPPLQIAFAALFWLYFSTKNSAQICTNKWLRLLAFVNFVIIAQCYHHPLNVVVISSLLHVLLNKQISRIEEVLLGVLISVKEPVYILVLVLKKINQYQNENHNNKERYKAWGQSIAWLLVSLLSVFTLNYQTYFLTQFEKSSGVTWILYSHQFEKYLLLYQTLLTISPYIILLPLSLISIPPFSKLTVLYFICTFTNPSPTLIHVWALYCLESLCYGEIMQKATKRQQVIWNTLSLMLIVITVPTYAFYQRLIWVWQNSHMISVGYFLLQNLLFWGTHSVYLSELLVILDQPEKEDKTKLIQKLIRYVRTRVAQM